MFTSKILTAVITAAALALPATAAFAGKPKEVKQCGGAPCEGKIDIELEILKACELLVGNDIMLKQDSYTGTSDFTVTTNTPYKLHLTTANAISNTNTFVKHTASTPANVISIPTKITTTKGGSNYPIGTHDLAGMSVDKFNVSVAPTTAISATQRAGTYKDTLYIKVSY